MLADDINTVSAFLAECDLPALDAAALEARIGTPRVDCVVLLGNSLLPTAEAAFGAIAAGLSTRLLITGGVGHSTPPLREAMAAHPRYRDVDSAGRGEADLLAEIATRHWCLDPASVLTEHRSTNCGENAIESRRLLETAGLEADTILLLQDPTMQRRSHATFRHVWAQATARRVTFVNFPTFVPAVEAPSDGGLRFTRSPTGPGLAPGGALLHWPMPRFLSLILGEIPRLRDDEAGYGPRGRGFIDHVDIPADVLAAHDQLATALQGAVPDRTAPLR
jgi:uncharacterized SAM-binding protein YcdF (DUF218 family)